MAKDPSVLFYTSDFLAGTAHFTREEKGFYIELLCHQQQRGSLSFDFIQRIGGMDFHKLWPGIMDKFLRDEKDCFYNERMRTEIARRKKFTESRRNNLKPKDLHMEDHKEDQVSDHMGNQMENENENEIDNTSIKEKESKKIKFSELVSMTNEQHSKLIETYGQVFTNGCITILDNYKGSSGKKYKDDYRAILSWVVQKMQKENPVKKGKIETEFELNQKLHADHKNGNNAA